VRKFNIKAVHESRQGTIHINAVKIAVCIFCGIVVMSNSARPQAQLKNTEQNRVQKERPKKSQINKGGNQKQ